MQNQAGKSNQAFGRYSCAEDGPNFLWAAADAGVKRATLRWAFDAGDPFNGVLR
jgi:hypothetical protein